MLIPNDPERNNLKGGAVAGRLAVLGGCGGIGRVLVDAALRRNLKVAVLDLEASLTRHPLPDQVATFAIDATDDVSLKDAFVALDEKWSGLDGFVNLCGFMHDNQPSCEMSVTVWDEIIAGNLRTVFSAAQHALPLLKKGDDASIVHTASGLAQYIRPGFGAYAAAKSAVIALTKTLAFENAPDVRCNAVAPGAVDTAFLRGGTGRSDENAASHVDEDVYTRTIPLQRIAVPEDVVDPIMFLLSDASRYMTGQVLWINGGAYMP